MVVRSSGQSFTPYPMAVPLWRILDETDRALGKFGWPDELIIHRREQLARHFSEANIEGFEPIEACVANDPKDRHVLAAAIRGKCEIIVTFNLKDFPTAALEPWNIEAHHPSKFLSSLYSLNQASLSSGSMKSPTT